jgi:hypothetical protein
MTTENQPANPQTDNVPESRSPARFNALSHGIFSHEILLEGEDAALLAGLREKLYTEFKPECELEAVLIERILSGIWRLKRALKSEQKCSPDSVDYRYGSWGNLIKYETTVERQIYRAINKLEQLQQARTRSNSSAVVIQGKCQGLLFSDYVSVLPQHKYFQSY